MRRRTILFSFNLTARAWKLMAVSALPPGLHDTQDSFACRYRALWTKHRFERPVKSLGLEKIACWCC